jgi:histidinol-phosphate aminotransferase
MTELSQTVKSILRPEVLALSPYHVADSAGYIKLDAMENPYAWPQAMVDEWLEPLRGCEPNRYPDPSAEALKAIIRTCNAVPDSTQLLLGNGSDELIQIILMAVAGGNAVVLAPEPTFVMYRHIARTLGLRFESVPLLPDTFGLDMEAMRDALLRFRPAVVFLAYPNNPTGNLFAAEDIVEILKLAPGLVVIDEAYAPFADASFMPMLTDYDQLLVMRTVSKLGLAGLRLGFLAGAGAWIEQLDKLRLPYNINVLTQVSVEFALSRYDVLEEQARRICEDRTLLFAALSSLADVSVSPSRANFILFKLERADADVVHRGLKEHGILIKNLNPIGGALANCLRVTVGTPAENASFIEAMKRILS